MSFKFNRKKLICLLALFVAAVIAAAASLAYAYRGGIPVLNYHQINSKDHNSLTVSTEQFAAQMDYLAENGYHTITPDEMADALENGTELPDNPILITFDDGYLDNYKNAFPVYSVPKLGGQHAAYLVAALKEYQDGSRAHATMYASMGFLL